MKRVFLKSWMLSPVVFFLSIYYGLLIFFSGATDKHNLNIRDKIVSTLERVNYNLGRSEYVIFKNKDSLEGTQGFKNADVGDSQHNAYYFDEVIFNIFENDMELPEIVL